MPTHSGLKYEAGVVALDPPPSDAEIRKLQRRIDLRIMPWICLTYLIMRIDLSNVANAAIINLEQGHGIKQQLGLSPQQWNWVISCFFYPYAFFEPVSTLLMKYTKPSFWIGRIMIVWGIVVCCIASVNSYGALVACRVCAAEAGYYPCIIYYLAFWFRPEELAIRIATFTSFGLISSFAGGFLAYAVSFADGAGGLAGWRWLFITEGMPAVLLGLITLYIMPDYPETSSFLSERETAIITSRLSKHSPSSLSKTWDGQQVLQMLADPLFWTFTAIWCCHAVGGNGLSYVLPTVIYELGFTTTALSNALSMPPSLTGFILLNMLGWLIQKKDWNPFLVAIGLELASIVCCILLLTVRVGTSMTHSPFNSFYYQATVVRYLALLVATASTGCFNAVLLPSRVKAVRGTTAAGVAIGITSAASQLSGILGPQVFSTIYGPTYRISFLICGGLLMGAILFVTASGILMGRIRGDLFQWSVRTETKQ